MNEEKRVASEAGGGPTDTGAKRQGIRRKNGQQCQKLPMLTGFTEGADGEFLGKESWERLRRN